MSSLYIAILYFAIYSMLGWVCEVIYCSIPAKHFINRGFLNGPYCPVYGFGALIVIYILFPFTAYPLLVFTLATLLTSTLEYLTSYILEKSFNAHWWDYSKRKFNIHGRVCLLNSSLFGILCLVLVYLVHPIISNSISHILEPILPLIVMGFECLFCTDIVVTLYTIGSLKARIHSISDISSTLKEKLAQFEQKQVSKLSSLKNNEMISYLESELSKRLSKKNILHKRLLDAFPHMQFIQFEEYVEKLRNRLK